MTTVTISAAVGNGGSAKCGVDVRNVQKLLNQAGAKPRLAEDGIVGPNTIRAIRQFQSAFMTTPDGRVDPGGPTLRKLNIAASGAIVAELMIISETGMFHSACRCTYQSSVEWYGFQPARARSPISGGRVDRSDRTSYINHLVEFEISTSRLRRAVRSVAAEYRQKDYILGVCDCVSFSADVARQCGLRVPRVNMTPWGFIKWLSVQNEHVRFE
jgi:peptidoglycan hydrolase-like protein with peptidoglycan-binding domain